MVNLQTAALYKIIVAKRHAFFTLGNHFVCPTQSYFPHFPITNCCCWLSHWLGFQISSAYTYIRVFTLVKAGCCCWKNKWHTVIARGHWNELINVDMTCMPTHILLTTYYMPSDTSVRNSLHSILL